MRHQTLIMALMALLLVGGAAAWKFMPHRLSYDECSEVYRHFADLQLPGVSITYVRDKVVNDTLRLPVTLLKAENDEGWEALDDLFGYTRQIEAILDIPELPDSVKREFIETPTSFYSFRANHNIPEVKANPYEYQSDDIFVYVFPNMRCVTIYEPDDAKNEREAVSSKAIKSQQEINN